MMDSLDNNDYFCQYMSVFIGRSKKKRKKKVISFIFFHVLTGVCCPVLGEQLCQRFTWDKPVLNIYRFLACVCGWGNTEQEDRRREASELSEETAVASLSTSE